jgi:hypothetical protein
LVLAVINGGIGIQYAANAVPAEKGYGVVTGMVGLFYIGVVAWWYVRGRKTNKADKQGESSRGSEEVEQVQYFVGKAEVGSRF